MSNRSWLIALAVCAALPRADAAPAASSLLRDPAALAGWLAHHDLQVAALSTRTEAARAAREQASVLPNPQLSAALGGIVLGATNPAVDPATARPLSFGQTANITLGVAELVELGKRGPRQRAAQLRLDEAHERGVASLGQSLGDATLALARVAYLEHRRHTIADDLASARQLEHLEQLRVDKGDLAAGELMHLQLEASGIAAQLRRTEADLAAAHAACSAALYLPCELEPQPADVLAAIAPLPAQLPTAIAERPSLRAEQLAASALDADAALARARRIPDPTLSLAYTYDTFSLAGNQSQMLVASVAFPLPLFDRGTHDAAAARATARAVREDVQAQVHQATSTVAGLLEQRDRLQASLDQVTQQDLPRSATLVEQTRRAFDVGQARVADLLLAERSDRDLGLEALDLQFDLLAIRVQCRQLLGLDDQLARTTGVTP